MLKKLGLLTCLLSSLSVQNLCAAAALEEYNTAGVVPIIQKANGTFATLMDRDLRSATKQDWTCLSLRRDADRDSRVTALTALREKTGLNFSDAEGAALLAQGNCFTYRYPGHRPHIVMMYFVRVPQLDEGAPGRAESADLAPKRSKLGADAPKPEASQGLEWLWTKNPAQGKPRSKTAEMDSFALSMNARDGKTSINPQRPGKPPVSFRGRIKAAMADQNVQRFLYGVMNAANAGAQASAADQLSSNVAAIKLN